MPRPITPADRNAMADLVRDAVQRTFQPDAGVTAAGQPVRDFLAGPAPTTIFSRIQWDMGRETCRRWAAGKSSSILPSRESFLRDTCTPYITGAFGAPGSGAVQPEIPGGQCAGVEYAVAGRRINEDGTVNSNWSNACGNFRRGPIGLYRDVFPTQISMGFTYHSSQGVQLKSEQWTAGPTSTGKITLDTVTRCDGLPDDCGNGSPTYDPGAPVTGIPGPAPIPNPPGNPWPFPEVTIEVNPDGTITVDFGDDTPPVTVDPGSEDGSPGDDTPTNPGDAGDPEETGPGGESSGCAPAGSELTGVFVEIVEFPENAARFQNNSRQPFRGAGYIAMGWPDLLGVDVSGGVINLAQFFHAQQRGITCWRVTANIGFELRCTPYYRELNPEEEEEE